MPFWDPQMADSVVPQDHCGTSTPGWLNGSHPEVVGQNVIQQVCFNYWHDTCWENTNVEIKNCGGFYIYKLEVVPFCDYKYCGQ